MNEEARWKVVYSKKANQNLEEIYNYIAEVTLELDIAKRQVARIKEAADSLNLMPKSHHLHYDERLRVKGVRVLLVDKYVVWYIPDEKKKHVKITRVIHNKRNIDNVLNEPEQ
jgi:toxin ParE1/3/4